MTTNDKTLAEYEIDHRKRVSMSLRNWATRLREGAAQDHEDAFRRLADVIEITADCPAERDTALMDGTRVVQAAQRCVHAAEDFARDLEGLSALIAKSLGVEKPTTPALDAEVTAHAAEVVALEPEACR